MAYITVLGACYVCRVPFTFNPLHVPSVRVNGVREPICEPCMAHVNRERIARGQDPFDIHPDAYVGEPEQNVPLDDE